MGQMIITDLDDGTLDRLRIRASILHQTVEQTVSDILKQACGDQSLDLVAEMNRIRSLSQPVPMGAFPTTEDMIREDRDAR